VQRSTIAIGVRLSGVLISYHTSMNRPMLLVSIQVSFHLARVCVSVSHVPVSLSFCSFVNDVSVVSRIRAAYVVFASSIESMGVMNS